MIEKNAIRTGKPGTALVVILTAVALFVVTSANAGERAIVRTEVEAQAATASDQSESPSQTIIQAEALRGVGARTAALLQSGKSGGEVDGAVVWTSNGNTDESGSMSFRFFIEMSECILCPTITIYF